MRFKLLIIYYLIRIRWTRFYFGSSIKKLQAKRYKRFLSNLNKSPYYASLLKEGKGFPVMNKISFMKHFDTINTKGVSKDRAMRVALAAEGSRDFNEQLEDGLTVGLSSGTSGNRGLFLASPSEKAFWVAAILDRVVGLSFKKRQVAFFLRANSKLYESAKSRLLAFHYFDLMEDTQLLVDKLAKVNVDILVAPPSMLMIIAEAQQNKRIKIQPQKIISVAEVLTLEDKKHLKEVFNQDIHQVYQCTEGFLASTCKHGNLHFNEDFILLEKKYIDKEKKRYHPIITDMIRSTQAVVRYELNDILHESNETCTCGSPFELIAQIEGRSDDILLFKTAEGKEVRIFPDFFRRAIIMADESIHNYMLIQQDYKQLALYIESKQQTAFIKAVKALQDMLAQRGLSGCKIIALDKMPINRGDKLRRIQNGMQKKY